MASQKDNFLVFSPFCETPRGFSFFGHFLGQIDETGCASCDSFVLIKIVLSFRAFHFLKFTVFAPAIH